MKKARYQVINSFQTLDDDGDWSNDYQEGDILWRIIGTNKFEDVDATKRNAKNLGTTAKRGKLISKHL